jgi:[ribosomal protein S18]-alanine N-acetyltransferase
VRSEQRAAFALRPMTHSDLPRVAAIEAAALPTPWSEQAFSNELDLPFSCARIAVPRDDPGAIAGYVVWWRVADEIHLLDLAVADESRRRGVGRLLVAAVLDDARSRAARVVTLEVAADNSSALALYLGQGFAETMRRRDYYGPGRDALVMEHATASIARG